MLGLLLAIVGLQLNLEDLRPLYNGKPILIPGIAASEQVLNLEWSDEKIKDLKKGDAKSPAEVIQVAERKDPSGIRGVTFKMANEKDLIEGVETLEFVSQPKADNPNESPFVIRVGYVEEEMAKSALEIAETLKLPIEIKAEVSQRELAIQGVFDLTDSNKVITSVLQLIGAIVRESEEKKAEITEKEDSIGEIIEILPERSAAILAAETAYFRREFFEPVAKAYENESEDRKKSWKGVLQTAEDCIYYLSGGILPSWREYLGRGAEDAFKKGCYYPIPLAYSYASLIKRDAAIQDAFGKAYENLKTDDRWNTASRLMFYSFLAIGKNAPESITNEEKTDLKRRELKTFLKEARWTSDELGGVYQLASFAAGHELGYVLNELEAEGVELDPWLKTMFLAEIAYRKAWDARGAGYANTVTEEGWRIYGEEIAKVLPLAEKAYNLRPDLPQSSLMAMKTCYGDEGRERFWLNRVMSSRPGYLNAHAQYLWGTRPRWGGSLRKMAAFCLGLAKRGEFETAVPIFAYERLVNDVFYSEGGITTDEGSYPNVDKFIQFHSDIFGTYFKGYKESGFYKNASFLERMHVAVALAEIAWRLENVEEFLYWVDETKRLGMPVKETQFAEGFHQYNQYVDDIRKLSDGKRKTFLAGVHALHSNGNNAAIDKMSAIAREIGNHQLAFECALSRRGKCDLRAFLKGGNQNTQNYSINFGRKARDHMIFRFQVRGSSNYSRTTFSYQLFALSSIVGDESDSLSIQTTRSRENDEKNPIWRLDEETCMFELEISGTTMRLTQNGRRIWERKLHARPSQYSNFSIRGFVGMECTVEKFELEILDARGFEIVSEELPMPKHTPVKSTYVKPETPKLGDVEAVACRTKNGFIGGWKAHNVSPIKDDPDKAQVLLRTNSGIRLDVPDPKGDAATLIFEYDKLSKANMTKDSTIGVICFEMGEGKRPDPKDGIYFKCDPETGKVSAVAVENGKSWSSEGTLDLAAEKGKIAFGYDYQHGAVLYQRTKEDEPWKVILGPNKCRFRGKKPVSLTVGSSSFSSRAESIKSLTVKDIYIYPKVFTPEELGPM